MQFGDGYYSNLFSDISNICSPKVMDHISQPVSFEHETKASSLNQDQQKDLRKGE
jgi:hypothetical protein